LIRISHPSGEEATFDISITYKTAGAAKVRGSHSRHAALSVEVSVGIRVAIDLKAKRLTRLSSDSQCKGLANYRTELFSGIQTQQPASSIE
jgi:hypothetical protein